MKRTRKVAIWLLAVMVILLSGGCGKRFDASAYAKAALDVLYKNETEEYIKLTGASVEDVEKIFTKNMEAVMVSFEALNLPKDLYDKFRKLFEDLVKNVKYTVGESVQEEDGNFIVDVTIEPISLMGTFDQFSKESSDYASKVANDVINGAPVPTDKEMQNNIYKLYYDILKKTVDSGLTYEKAETVKVRVNQKKGGVYEILQQDMEAMNSRMILQQTP